MNAVFNLCPHTTCASTETMNICNFFIESLQTWESQKQGMSSSANFYYKIQAGRETECFTYYVVHSEAKAEGGIKYVFQGSFMALETHFAFNKFYSSQGAKKHTTVPFIEAGIKLHLHPAYYFSFTLGIYTTQ